MKEQLNLRLEALKQEFETGQARLLELDRQQVALRETLLRISGAIQVLSELLAEDQIEGRSDAQPLDNQAAASSAD